ncbi:DUF3857 domain-containing protein [Algibacter sp. 2305UL17-15]|uniref:DUF3857 domain-containing protein n=1 Tax=Algibacter sp. 2305UL17-15 TaxID=3231268 RepID=UPI00345A7FAA
MKQFLVILAFSLCLNLFSQSAFNSESYRVVLADIETNTFEKDTTAHALVIYEQGNSYVDPGDYDLRTEIKHKIKILNRDGFDKANIVIPLYNTKNRSEKVDQILATTYNKIDGKVIKTQLEEKDIFREKYNENYTLVKFTMPNIQPGSVITYSYKLRSPFMFKYKGWEFQDDIPKLYSEYKTSIPGNWHYHIKLVGYKKLDVETSDIKKTCLEHARGASADCAVSTYAMKDVPAFIEENHMTTKDNYLARIEYELQTFSGFDGTVNNYTKTWKDVDGELRSEPSIGKQLSKKLKPEDFFGASVINEPNNLKRAKAILKHVQENYTWNEEYSIFKKSNIKDLIEDKSGNVSSINILLHNLLKSCNINVSPVLVSTRKNGFPTKIYPVISDFNYLIVQAKIGGKTYLLDATDPYLSFGQIPFKCLNLYGRLLDFKNGSSWINIGPRKPSMSFIKTELNIDEAGNINGKARSRATGYHGLNKKKSCLGSPDAYVEKLQNKFVNLNIKNFETQTTENTSASFSSAFDFTLEEALVGDNLYINPFLFPFFKENPFKLQERTYPVDFGYKDGYFYNLRFTIDDAFEIVEIPKSALLKLADNGGLLNMSSNLLGNTVNITFKVDFKKPLYPAELYPYLKEFMNTVVDIQTNSLIVLKKK